MLGIAPDATAGAPVGVVSRLPIGSLGEAVAASFVLLVRQVVALRRPDRFVPFVAQCSTTVHHLAPGR